MPEEFECNSKHSLSSGTGRKQTILLVEDEQYVREVAREILEITGFRVIEASNPHEALEKYELHGGAVDLVLTDVVMPGMDGHDLAERLAQLQPSLRSIFMSGYTENTLLRRGIRDLNAVYLQKPFTLQALVDKVREVLASPTAHIAPYGAESSAEPDEAAC